MGQARWALPSQPLGCLPTREPRTPVGRLGCSWGFLAWQVGGITGPLLGGVQLLSCLLRMQDAGLLVAMTGAGQSCVGVWPWCASARQEGAPLDVRTM